MADRRCPCGAELADVGPRVFCSRCGRRAATWLVGSEGAVVAAATEREVLPGDELAGALRYAAGPSWSQ